MSKKNKKDDSKKTNDHDTKRDPSKKVAETSEKIEKKFDSAMENTSKYIDKRVGKNTKKSAENFGKKADAFAGSIEHFWTEVDQFTSSIFPASKGTKAVFNAGYTKKISRLFIFRFLWVILQGPIMFIWSIWIKIIYILHWLHMVVFWKRNKSFWKRQLRFYKHMAAWGSYLNGFTDQRPPLIYPELQEK